MKRLALSLSIAALHASPLHACDGTLTPVPPSGSSSVEGTVRDAEGAPIAGADVSACFHASPDIHFHRDMKTDARGSYAFAALPAGTAMVTMRADDCAGAARSSIKIADGSRIPGLDFTLSKGLAIGGRLADVKGGPVAGVSVSARPDKNAYAKGAARPAGSEGRSGEDGGYTIGSLGEGIYTVETVSPDFAPAKKTGIAAGSRGVDFVLKDAGGIAGTVRDRATGEPIADAKVSPVGLSGSHPLERTDEAGFYELEPLDTGTYTLEAKAEGYVSEKRAGIAVRGGEDTEGVDFALVPAPRIRGRVTVEGGAPAAGAELVLSKSFSSDMHFLFGFGRKADAIADAAGRYEIVKGEPGIRYEVQAQSKDCVPGKSAPFQLVPGRDQEGVDIVLKKGLSLPGKVTDEKGLPVAGAKVRATSRERGFSFSMDMGTSSGTGPGSAVADDSGAFTIEGLASGRHEVKASADGYGTGSTDVTLSPGAEPKPVIVVLRAGIAISGRVSDDGGNPLADADVSASGRGDSGYCRRSAETDEEGRYEIESLSPGTYQVTARLHGYGKGKAEGIVPPAKDVDFTLSAGGRIAGRVTDGGGRPVMTFSYLTDKAPHSDRVILKHGTAVSSEDGSFESKPLDPGDYAVTVNAEGFAPGKAEGIKVGSGKTARAEIKLGPAASIAGTVVREKGRAPVAGVRVSLLKDRDDDAFGFGLADQDLLEDAVLSDESGAFVIGDLPTGRFRLKASHPDFAEETVPVASVKEGETTRVEIALKKGRAISGVVKDAATSAPVEGASVTISADRDAKAGMLEKMLASMGRTGAGSATSDPAGKWEIANVAPGEYRLLAAHKDYAASESKPVTVKPDADAADIELILSGGARVHGAVKDAAGKAATGASVTAISENGMAHADADANGRYALEHLAPGTWTVSVAAGKGAGGDAGSTKPVSVAAGDDIALDFTLGGGFSVSGTVISRGAPLAEAHVSFSLDEGGEGVSASGESGKDGAYRVAGLPAGSYEVMVWKQGEGNFDSCRLPSRVAVSGDLAGQDIVLPSGVIAGTLTDGGGAPVEDVRVRCEKKDEDRKNSAESEVEKQMLDLFSSKKSGRSGAFELTMLGAGTYTLTAEKKGAGRASGTAVLASDDARAEVVLTLKPGFPLKLRAMSAVTGKPIERAGVRAVAKNGDRVKEEAVSAEAGVLVLPDIPEGTYRVEVGAAGHAPGKLDAVKIGPGEKGVTELKLEKGVTLSVTVSTAKGKPVQGAVVTLLDAVGKRYDPPGVSAGAIMAGGKIVTGSKGAAKFDSLPAAAFTVKASKAGMKSAEAKIAIKKGEDAKAALTLR